MAAVMKPSAPLNLSSLGPSRNLKELLADPVHYVAARHNSEPILPVGLVPINQSSQQPRSSPLDSALTPSISKQDNRDQPAASSSTSHKSNELSSNWPSGIQGAAHGLINNGNTCYLNATLQALVHTPPVVSTLPKLHSSRSCSNNQNCTLCRLVGLIQGAFHGHARAIVPHAILGRLKKIAPHFRRYEQEDAHEFLRLLLDSCVESEVSAKQLRVTPSLKDTTAVHRLFGGRFCSRVHCTKCKHNSDTYDSFLDVSLPLSHNTRDLHDSLNLFIKPDHLTGNNRYKCEKCKSLVNATKSLSINRAPFVLTVHLKRFSPLRKKITASIDYPETLDIGPWMTDGGQSAKYRLDSIVCHSGSSANAGHYYSFVRTSDGDWFRQDDSTSTKVAFHNQSHLLSMKSAYVLIYTRTDSEASSGLSSKSQLPSAVPLSTENKKASVPDSPSDTSIDGPQSISINEHQKMGPIAHGMKRKTLDDTGVTNNGRCTNRPRILSDLPSKAKYSNNPFSLNKVNDSPRSEPDLGERVDRSASRNPLLAKPENSEQDPFKNFSIPSGFSNKGHSAKAVTTAASAAGVSTFYGGGGGQSYRRVPHQYGGKHKPRRSY